MLTKITAAVLISAGLTAAAMAQSTGTAGSNGTSQATDTSGAMISGSGTGNGDGAPDPGTTGSINGDIAGTSNAGASATSEGCAQTSVSKGMRPHAGKESAQRSGNGSASGCK